MDLPTDHPDHPDNVDYTETLVAVTTRPVTMSRTDAVPRRFDTGTEVYVVRELSGGRYVVRVPGTRWSQVVGHASVTPA